MLRPFLLGTLLFALLAAPGFADPEYYLRNRPLKGRAAAGEVFISPEWLSSWFVPEEMERVRVEGGQVMVDGKPVAPAAPDGAVPVVAVAKALGFQVRPNPDMGLVDLVPPKAMLSHQQRAAVGLGGATLDAKRRPEYRMSAERMQRVLALLGTVRDPEAQARLDHLGNRVAAMSPLGGLPWNFYIVNEATPNAACVGEGHVFVTSGLLELNLTDDELAGVLGHEIAHGVRRHPFLRLDMFEELEALERQAEAWTERRDANYVSRENERQELEKRFESLIYRAENERAYDRAAEEEADVLGMQYAVGAGFSPDGLGRALQRLDAAAVKEFGQAVLEEDMSHPPVTRRLEILRRVQQNWKR